MAQRTRNIAQQAEGPKFKSSASCYKTKQEGLGASATPALGRGQIASKSLQAGKPS